MSRRGVDFVSTDEKLKSRLSKDQQLDALRRMRDLETNQESRAEIQEFIQKRIAELISEDS